MNSVHKLFAASLVACVINAAALAAEPSPAGTWKWTLQGRSGQSFDQTLKLDFRDGKLSGTLLGVQGSQFELPDTPISDASLQNGVIKFSVTREFNGTRVTTRYEGNLEGDAIKGTSERAGINGGEAVKREWNARRTS